MKKEHTVVITTSDDELAKIINNAARKAGLLKDVKSTVEYRLWDKTEVSVEYSWEE